MKKGMLLAMASVLLGSSSCGSSTGGDGSITPPQNVRAVTIVQAKSATDTIDAVLAQPLTAEIRDPRTGVVRTGVEVRFEAIDSADPTTETVVARIGGTFSRLAIDTTDVSGRARVNVRLGTHIGNRRVAVTALGASDTATYATTSGSPVLLRVAPRDTTVIFGRTFSQSVTSLDRGGNPSPVVPQFVSAAPDKCSVDANGTVHGLAYGSCDVRLSAGSLRDSTRVRVIPDGTILVRRGATLGTVSLDGSGFTKIADIDTIATRTPQWLASGREVAMLEPDVAGASHLAIMSLDGIKRTLATLPFPSGRQRVSGDGTWIASANLIPDSTLALAPASVVRVRQDGTATTLVGDRCCTYVATVTDISPDGTRIAYGDFGTGFLYDAGAGSRNKIGPLFGVRFSPDGTQLAMLSDNRGVTVRNAAGTIRVLPGLSTFGSFSGLAGWSRDSQWVLVSEFFGRTTWFVVSVADGTTLQLGDGLGSTFVVVDGWKP